MVIRIAVYAALFMIFWVLGYALCYVLHCKPDTQNNVGQLLMIEDDGAPMFMLEINAGKADQIKPGQDIILTVTRP